jgi:hypothetical protein
MKEQPSASESLAATACLALGVTAVFAWLIPTIGLIVASYGLVYGRRGWQAPNRDRARLGVVLAIIAIGLALWLAFWLIMAVGMMDI